MSYFGIPIRNGASVGLGSIISLLSGSRLAPSLSLNFLSGSLDSRIFFTRASTGTYFNSAGVLQTAAINAPRFDYNPSTLAAQGLLIEEARTNSLTYSEDYTQAAWIKVSSSITADAIVAPNGTLTGDKLVEDTANTQHNVRQLATVADNTIVTATVYAKAAERSFIRLSIIAKSGSFPGQYFNISNGTLGIAVASPIAASITSVGNGWYRCSVTADVVTGGVAPGVQIWIASANGVVSYTGDGTSGLYIWGAQLETGAFPTSYIPTTAAAATRAADGVFIGTLTPWYNQSEGTLFATVGYQRNGTVASFNDNTANNRWTTTFSATALGQALRNTAGAGLLTTSTANAAIVGATNKIALAISTGCSLVLNGGTVATNASYAAPTVTQLQIGNQLGAEYLNGYLRTLTYYPSRLSNAQLRALTV